ncbi:hypothetical protein HY642_01545 [Candidatus Woesearchaeota archaeon]|nr:hypothetical protein [Candidatus Woesearchaeota archaeon]
MTRPVDKKSFERMRTAMATFDSRRETIIRDSRDILKNSKAAIYSMHREDYATARKQLGAGRKGIIAMDAIIKQDPHLAMVGAYSEGIEEYVEASCLYGVLKEGRLPEAAELGVDVELYLQGVCDLVGELVRNAVNAAIKGNKQRVFDTKDFVASLYEELFLFDFRNTPVRRKFDQIKYGLEKLENLSLELSMRK